MTAPANWHDAVCLEDLLNSVVTERPDSEQHLCLDKGYDNPTGHQTVQEFDYVNHIAPVREESRKRQPGRRKARRWVVERLLVWLNKCRAILVRHDKHCLNHLGLLQLACALLWYRRLGRLRHINAPAVLRSFLSQGSTDAESVVGGMRFVAVWRTGKRKRASHCLTLCVKRVPLS